MFDFNYNTDCNHSADEEMGGVVWRQSRHTTPPTFQLHGSLSSYYGFKIKVDSSIRKIMCLIDIFN